MSPRKDEVLLTLGAEQDLERLFDHLALNDSPAAAQRLLEAAQNLEHFPVRGSRPRELAEVGNREFRQVFFKPHRLIYRASGSRVPVHVIADGRRDLQTLLLQRLPGA